MLNGGEIRVNRKRIQGLMRQMGIQGLAPGPSTSKSHPEHIKYPYLLTGLTVAKPMEVWSTDITYIRLRGGFVYLVAVIDWYSRLVLSWRLSNSLDTHFCLEALEEALKRWGTPAIFNTDQGAQFTAKVFVDAIVSKGIRLSMDGRGRALDNIFIERLWRSVKYEKVYLKDYENVREVYRGLDKYFTFYNNERPHFLHNEEVPSERWEQLIAIAKLAREKKRLSPREMEAIIIELCTNQWLTRRQISDLVQRNTDDLQSRFLTPMVEQSPSTTTLSRNTQPYRSGIQDYTTPQ
jgi:putative transposase